MYKALEQSIRSSEKHAELSDFAYRVWNQGLAVSDMVGRITANPRKFHAEAIPLLPYEEAKLLAAFNELKATRLCHFYEVDGKNYMVYHDHDEHNKGSKNLKYQPKSKIPPPPPSLCYCITYQPHEDAGVTAVETAVPTAVRTAIVPVPSLVPVHVHVQRGESEGETKGSTRFLALKWNKGPGVHLNGDKAAEHIQAAMDVGVDPQVIDQAFTNHHDIKGKKIWDVLDPLRKSGVSAGKSWEQIIKEASNG